MAMTNDDHVRQLNMMIKSDQFNADAAYYGAEHRPEAIGVSTPTEMQVLLAQVGWPRTYIDSIEERQDIEGFRLGGESISNRRLWDWWQANRLDVESSLGHIDALIHGRAYITVSAPDRSDPTTQQDSPVIRCESPRNMVAETDPRTRQVTRALRLSRSPGSSVDDQATLFFPDETLYLDRATGGGSTWRVTSRVSHRLGVVPVVPITNRARLSDRMGESEIVPELRSITDAAARIMMNMQTAAELMAVPQRLLFGVTRDALAANPEDPSSVLETYLSRIISVEDENASATSFSAADLRNFVEVLQELSKQAASYTGLPPQYLSFSSENPASAEAIKSAESRLVKTCERKNRIFGEAWEQVMRIAMLIMDGSVPSEAHRMETIWRDPSTPTYAAKADAVMKLATSISPDGRAVIPVERARMDLGYTDTERREMQSMDEETPVSQLASVLGTSTNSSMPSPSSTSSGAA